MGIEARSALRSTAARLGCLAAFWLLAALAPPASALDALTGHTVQARVNDEVITSQDVLRQVWGRWQELEESAPPNLEALKRQAWLEARSELVEEALLVAAGRRLAEQYPAVDHIIDRLVRIEIETQRRDMGGEGRLLDYVEQEMGLTYTEYREQHRRKKIREFVYGREIMRPVEVRISEMRDFYERNLDRFRESPTVRFDQIVLPLAPGRDLEETKERARHLAARIREGEDLLSAVEGEGAFAEEAPPTPRRVAALAPPLRQALEGLRPGAVSDPVVMGEALAPDEAREIRVLRLVERRETEAAPFEEAQEAIRWELVAERRAKRFQALLRHLREMHYVWEAEGREGPTPQSGEDAS